MTDNKKVVFFDAEGTLYVPKEGRTFDDFWEGGEHSLERALENFELNDGVEEVLEGLQANGHELVVISLHREDLLPDLLDELGIGKYFTAVLVNGDKGVKMEKYLETRRIPKENALIVGDKYDIDIEPAEKVGIRGLLLNTAELASFRDVPLHV